LFIQRGLPPRTVAKKSGIPGTGTETAVPQLFL